MELPSLPPRRVDTKGGRCQAYFFCPPGGASPPPCPAGYLNSAPLTGGAGGRGRWGRGARGGAPLACAAMGCAGCTGGRLCAAEMSKRARSAAQTTACAGSQETARTGASHPAQVASATHCPAAPGRVSMMIFTAPPHACEARDISRFTTKF